MIVCCSAKTRSEQQVHRRQLRIDGPYIVENGAALHGDEGDALEVLGLAYSDVRDRLARAASRLGVTVHGFADMSTAVKVPKRFVRPRATTSGTAPAAGPSPGGRAAIDS